MLYPQNNSFRSSLDLSGFWTFLPDPNDEGVGAKWFDGLPQQGRMTISVPGSWNEQLAEKGLFNYVGPAWYHKTLEARIDTDLQSVILRVAAADHHATVWLNGKLCGTHSMGYMPFEINLNDAWVEGGSNELIIRVDNRLTMETIPQDVRSDVAPYDQPQYDRRHLFPQTRFDFFPYGGLTRSVSLLVLPKKHLKSIRIDSKLNGEVKVGFVTSSKVSGIRVTLLDGDKTIASAVSENGYVSFQLSQIKPWSPSSPFLYKARVEILDGDKSGNVTDQYTEKFGVREVAIEGGQLLLNGEPLYLTGFGKHEEFPIVGRGQFRAGYLRDFELMRWTGANSFRTSHYPYDEEIMQLADELGFLVIDEVPAVSVGFLSDKFEDLVPLLDNHRKSVKALVERDYNHPSVICWSIANEPNLWSEPHYQNEASSKYFQQVYNYTKNLDDTRPVMTITIPAFGKDDVSLDACDIIGINRYYGWYTEPADLGKAKELLSDELDAIYKKHKKPIVVTEFGADTIDGYHATYPQLFTEEYQTAFIKTYCDVIDSKPFCAGTHVWNFADFLTPQHFRRVVLNRKGVFTRVREPKASAFWLRDHWLSLKRVKKSHRPEQPLQGFLIPDVRPGNSVG